MQSESHARATVVEPGVIWFTGLSGAGKTTLSTKLVEYLKSRGQKVELLDGDQIRKAFPQTGFTRPEREEHIRRVSLFASSLQEQGVWVVAALISPYEECRKFARARCGTFVEVHVATPLTECEKRDPKGLYAKARNGQIKNFTGIDDPYEPPRNPEISLDTSTLTVDEAISRVTSYIERFLKIGKTACST